MLIVSKGALASVAALGITSELVQKGEKVLAREVCIYGAKLPSEIDWQSDWVYGKRWAPAYFRSYDFYESNKDKPYDVRRVWELSRLSFLPFAFQASALSGDPKFATGAFSILRDWEEQNPLAYTVNWDPMEASIRGFNLLLNLEVCQETGLGSDDDHALLWRILAVHGEFVWRNVEYTDVRGNHYAANLLALLFLGLKLAPTYAPARRWAAYAESKLADEIDLQFTPDGVDIEKSIPYHRLVTEIFLLARVALSRIGRPLKDGADNRLRDACRFAAAYTRPDGLAPNWADNDNAKLTLLDPVEPNDHRGLLSLGALVYRDSRLKGTAESLFPFSVWVYGSAAQPIWDTIAATDEPPLVRFEAGGFEIARTGGAYLIVDTGEVGLKGRGGHGHLDLFSFEFFCGIPVVVDPGSYVYTGDPVARKLFRGGAYHNVLLIDDQDLGIPSGMWDVKNAAKPESVSSSEVEGVIIIEGCHRGFTESRGAIVCNRRFVLEQTMLKCEDSVSCAESHKVSRFLHFDSGFEVSVEGCSAVGMKSGHSFLVSWDAPSTGAVEEGWVSYGYGEKLEATILRLSTDIQGAGSLWFTVVAG